MLKQVYIEFMAKSTDKVVTWVEHYDTLGFKCIEVYCSMDCFDPSLLTAPEEAPYFKLTHVRIINRNEVPPVYYCDEYYGWDAPESHECDPIFICDKDREDRSDDLPF